MQKAKQFPIKNRMCNKLISLEATTEKKIFHNFIVDIPFTNIRDFSLKNKRKDGGLPTDSRCVVYKCIKHYNNIGNSTISFLFKCNN